MTDTPSDMTPKRSSGDRQVEHFVDPQPFDPYTTEALTPEQERFYLASQWKMMWWKFKRHKIAVVSGLFLLLLYGSIPFTEIIAPYDLESRDSNHLFAPPQRVHLFHEGEFIGPFVYGYESKPNLETFRWEYSPDPSQVYPLRFFCRGDRYKFWNLWYWDFHLVCPAEGGTFFLLGTDKLGHDIFSRIVYGTRISLTVGLIGITISFVLGIVLGGLAGLLRRLDRFDHPADHRDPEIVARTAPLARPVGGAAGNVVADPHLSRHYRHSGASRLPGLARAVRSKLLALREEDYATAAVLMGATPKRVIARHLLPNFMSHLIASATLSIPAMILGETALSFLGLGLRPPITSWGVLLNEAQNLASIEFYPWIMSPMIPVILVILAFNFLGDGLRDAADPYK